MKTKTWHGEVTKYLVGVFRLPCPCVLVGLIMTKAKVITSSYSMNYDERSVGVGI